MSNEIIKSAAVFPGQASQYVGMGKDLYESSADVRKLYALATSEIGEDLAEISFNGPTEKLRQTRFTQPAILTHSLAVLTILGDALPRPHTTAGHSLGEYGALALAGVMSFSDAIRLVVKRAALMESASQARPGGMAAILGMELPALEDICREVRTLGVTVPANINSGGQIAISGDVAAVEEAARLAKERGAKRAIMLEVGGAFHSPLMQSAQDGMAQALATISLARPSCQFIPNVTATSCDNPDEIRGFLVRQITSPVRWAETMQSMKQAGVSRLIEIGPGKVLCGLAKRELSDCALTSLDTLADIEAFAATLSPVA